MQRSAIKILGCDRLLQKVQRLPKYSQMTILQNTNNKRCSVFVNKPDYHLGWSVVFQVAPVECSISEVCLTVVHTKLPFDGREFPNSLPSKTDKRVVETVDVDI